MPVLKQAGCTPGSLFPRKTAPAEHCALGTLRPQKTLRLGLLCPPDTLPPEHCKAQTKHPRNTKPPDHTDPSTQHTMSLERCARGTLCPKKTMPGKHYHPPPPSVVVRRPLARTDFGYTHTRRKAQKCSRFRFFWMDLACSKTGGKVGLKLWVSLGRLPQYSQMAQIWPLVGQLAGTEFGYTHARQDTQKYFRFRRELIWVVSIYFKMGEITGLKLPPSLVLAMQKSQINGPYAYCSLDKGVACAQHIQLLAW